LATVLKIWFDLVRLVSSIILILPYFTWTTWRAKSAFKQELLRSGVPKDLADNLADSYGRGNKIMVGSLFRPSRLTVIKRLGEES
jgi:hypothetical protein